MLVSDADFCSCWYEKLFQKKRTKLDVRWRERESFYCIISWLDLCVLV